MTLPEIIIRKIEQEGPLSFRDYMEMALYYPGHGYYTSTHEKFGKAGDFYTSPYLTALFGEMIAGQLEEMWQLLGRGPFTIVECGAGNGLLCRDILSRLKENKELFGQLRYFIVEKSLPLRERERQLLSAADGKASGAGERSSGGDEGTILGKVSWYDTIRDLPPVQGCFLSNELLDNLSVHQVVMEDQLMEVFVGYENGFTEILRPAPAALKDYFRQLGVELSAGVRTEVNLEATEWLRDIAAVLEKGYVMTIDYGFPSSALYSKKEGTLICYHRHRVNHSPYDFIGEQDITSHVNFSALDHWGRNYGLECCGFTNQTHFLQGLGLTRRLQQLETLSGGLDPAVRQERLLQLRTLLLDMGRKFKVLIQRKGLGRQFLSGLQFTQVLA
jgi:SAM-dependent MidA family methyltransferase